MVGNNDSLGRIPQLLNTRQTLCVHGLLVRLLQAWPMYCESYKGTHSILRTFLWNKAMH